MAARARLQAERNALRKDREWIRNPQNKFGFEAKPALAEDGTQDLLKWFCSIPGEKGTPWEGGRMGLTLTFTSDYPTAPPTAQFKPVPMSKGVSRPLFHANVYGDGKVCLDLLKTGSGGGWTPAHTVKTVLIAIQRLLNEPNPKSPAQSEPNQLYMKNRPQYEARIKQQMEVLKDTWDA